MWVCSKCSKVTSSLSQQPRDQSGCSLLQLLSCICTKKLTSENKLQAWNICKNDLKVHEKLSILFSNCCLVGHCYLLHMSKSPAELHCMFALIVVYILSWDACVGDICRTDTTAVHCPTLILHGAKDPLVPRFHPEFLQQNIKNSRQVESSGVLWLKNRCRVTIVKIESSLNYLQKMNRNR